MTPIMCGSLTQWLDRLAGTERGFASGAHLFHQGDEVRVGHVVREGAVHLIRHQVDGSAIVLHRAEAGMLVAEASLFSPRYHCDAVAVGPTRTATIPKHVFIDSLATEPGFAGVFAAHLAHEVQNARLRAEILSLRTVAERLDAWIAWSRDGLPPRGAWKDVAVQIGTSPEALYRELARRRKKGAAPVPVPSP